MADKLRVSLKEAVHRIPPCSSDEGLVVARSEEVAAVALGAGPARRPEVLAEVVVALDLDPAHVAHLVAAHALHFVAALALVEVGLAVGAGPYQRRGHLLFNVLTQPVLGRLLGHVRKARAAVRGAGRVGEWDVPVEGGTALRCASAMGWGGTLEWLVVCGWWRVVGGLAASRSPVLLAIAPSTAEHLATLICTTDNLGRGWYSDRGFDAA